MTVYATIPIGGDVSYDCHLLFRLVGYRDEKIDCSTDIGAAHKTLPPITVKLRKPI
jgi:hypothetical protein